MEIIGKELVTIPGKKLATSGTNYWYFSPLLSTFIATEFE
jgi:hypothetical protein